MSLTKSSTAVEAKLGKRKRNAEPDPEIEIDVSLPEPLSKKELRKAKKQKTPKTEDASGDAAVRSDKEKDGDFAQEAKKEDESREQKRSQYGVWIGNLPWTCDRTALKVFFTVNAPALKTESITRIHMPAPPPNPKEKYNKPVNKGFAYVDFATQEDLDAALALSETPMGGRKVLIKDAKDFNGRPAPTKGEGDAEAPAKKSAEPKRATDKIFVGNLGFEITKEEIKEHFEQCGEVTDVFLATFEDSGKCKGYGWVTFGSVEGAKAAERGFVMKQPEADDSDDEATESKDRKVKKPRKWFVNKLQGRPLRCEFAEDASSRYNKRFKKGRPKDDEAATTAAVPREVIEEVKKVSGPAASVLHKRKRDARTIAPGAAHMDAQRSTGGIVQSTGKKILFD